MSCMKKEFEMNLGQVPQERALNFNFKLKYDDVQQNFLFRP